MDLDPVSREAIYGLYLKDPIKSARDLFSLKQKIFLVLALIIVLLLWFYYEFQFLKFCIIGLNLIYLLHLGFKSFLFLISINVKEKEIDISSIKNFPIYTILVPLYKEHKIIKQLVDSLNKIDYPKEKLDIKLIIEADDEITIKALEEVGKLESQFEIIKVPYSLPRTKPKACNYALHFAKGEYVTIYDAEDIPDIYQLKKVLKTFENSEENVICIQSRLNFYNRKRNFLTQLFVLEYGAWFNFMLPALARLDSLIPLGGTSNHFKRKNLNELGNWDPFNVTEDADLGVRINALKYKTKIINSTTLEEAPHTLSMWLKQRSRWIQGYIQTYIVHMRKPLELGFKGFLGLQLFIGLPSLVFIISPIMWLATIYFLYEAPIYLEFSELELDLFKFNLFSGFLFSFLFSLVVIIRFKWWDLLFISLFSGFYWFLHSIASYKSIKQLIINPHYWQKTSHG